MNDNILDTLINAGVFVFLGLLIYLYFKPSPSEPGDDRFDEDEDTKSLR